MKTDSINSLNALIIRNNDGEQMTLIENETKVKVITDKSEYEEDYSVVLTFINEYEIEIDNEVNIDWDYIKEVIVLN